jgi:hypothetical protein
MITHNQWGNNLLVVLSLNLQVRDPKVFAFIVACVHRVTGDVRDWVNNVHMGKE